jgi:hypothetical protein
VVVFYPVSLLGNGRRDLQTALSGARTFALPTKHHEMQHVYACDVTTSVTKEFRFCADMTELDKLTSDVD